MNRWLLWLGIVGSLSVSSILRAAPDLHSQQAILIDLTTGTVLYEKNPDVQMTPSSMSKMMTVYMIFAALKRGDIQMDSTYLVSEKAWRKGGSRMFLKLGSQVSVEDLLKGVIIQSGNDAAIALAEGYGGSEDVFAEQMTRLGQTLGLQHTTFVNATGWPDPNHLSTVRDLATIAIKTIQDFPEYYGMYREKEFVYNDIKQMNRNPLLYSNVGADGLKTGHTDSGGYGVVASAVQGNRRLVLAINGAKSAKVRAQDAEALMGYGFSAFISPRLLTKGHELDRADVWLGEEKTVPLAVDADLFVTLLRDQLPHLKVDLIYKNPLEAPLKAGQQVGKVVVILPNGTQQEVPLKTARAVDQVGFFGKISAAVSYLLKGHN